MKEIEIKNSEPSFLKLKEDYAGSELLNKYCK